MKAILYMSTVLMTGAILYGFVDYSKTSSSSEFKTLYQPQEAGTVTTTSVETKPAVIPEKKNSDIKKEIAPVKSNGTKKIRAKKDMRVKKDIIPVATISPYYKDESLPVLVDDKTESALKEIKKAKRVNHRMFSRAALKQETPVKKTKKGKE